MGELSKTRSVLPVRQVSPTGATFHDDEAHVERVELPVDIFEELGRPDFITVTVEPGDLLNEEAADGER